MKRFSRAHITAIAAFATLGALYLCIPDVRIVMHALVNDFATGRSSVKSFLFILYVLCCLILYGAVKNRPAGKRSARAAASAAVSLATLAYLLNFAMYLAFMIRYRLPLFTYTIVHHNGTFTSMQFLHNHIYKGAIAIFTYLPHLLPTGLADDGRPFIGLFPTGLFIGAAVLLIGAFAALMRAFIGRIPELRSLSRSRRAAFLILFIICSFMILKSIVDGGPLSFEAAVSYPFLLLLLMGDRKWVRVTAVTMLIGYQVLLGVLYLCGTFVTDGAYGHLVFATVTALMILATPYAVYAGVPRRLGMLVGLFALVCAAGQFYSSLNVYVYLWVTVPSDRQSYVISELPIDDPQYVPQGTFNELRLYGFTPSAGTPMSAILPRTGLPVGLDPVGVPYQSCVPNGPQTIFAFDVDSKAPLTTLSEQAPLFNFSATPMRNSGPDYLYNATVSIPQCYDMMQTQMVDDVMSRYSDLFFVSAISPSRNESPLSSDDN